MIAAAYALVFCLDAACLSGPMVRWPMTQAQCEQIAEDAAAGACVRIGWPDEI